MHYIRLLRPPTIDTSDPDNPVLSLLLTITTDLGESFLYPDEPIKLSFSTNSDVVRGLYICSRPLEPVDGRQHVQWEPGMRVLNIKLRFEKKLVSEKCHVLITAINPAPEMMLSLFETRDLLPWRVKEGGGESKGLVASLTLKFDAGGVFSASVRELACQHRPEEMGHVKICIEEDIGESIARHIWDAGLVTAALLADSCRTKKRGHRTSDFLPLDEDKEKINILELGCGVGILGIAIASVIRRAAEQQGIKSARPAVLLTDLPEAEERARSNISRYQEFRGWRDSSTTNIDYENLDWEEGRNSRFGPIVGSKCWDFVVLSDCTYNVDAFPALVGTLASLHALNMTKSEPEERDGFTTRVLMSTKPRHDSEKALFKLLEDDGWSYSLKKAIPLPKINGDTEIVEVYLIEKKAGSIPSSRKRKGTNTVLADKPSKRSTSAV